MLNIYSTNPQYLVITQQTTSYYGTQYLFDYSVININFFVFNSYMALQLSGDAGINRLVERKLSIIRCYYNGRINGIY